MNVPDQIVPSDVPRIERGYACRVSSVTRPKNWPAPLRAQRRSGVALSTVISLPAAVISFAETIFWPVFPQRCDRAQIPPPKA